MVFTDILTKMKKMNTKTPKDLEKRIAAHCEEKGIVLSMEVAKRYSSVWLDFKLEKKK